jgi:hypothetical protein
MKTITLLLLLITGIGLQAQSLDCSGMKTGKFYIPDPKLDYQIERTEEFQYEKIGKIEITTRIVWLSDCEYKLVFVKGNKAYYKEVGKNTPKPDVIVEVTEVEGNTYTIKYAAVGSSTSMQGKLVKVE